MNIFDSVCEASKHLISRRGVVSTIDSERPWVMEDKPPLPKWFNRSMAFLAIEGMAIPLVVGVAGFIKNEIMRSAAIERTK